MTAVETVPEFVLLTGSLGSGKTTLLCDYLSLSESADTGVIVNEAWAGMLAALNASSSMPMMTVVLAVIQVRSLGLRTTEIRTGLLGSLGSGICAMR